MTYAIRTDLPVPEIKRGAPQTYPFATMERGHSFTAELGADPEKTINKLKGAAQRWKKSNGIKDRKFLVARTEAEVNVVDPETGLEGKVMKDVIGVWRTE